MLSRLCRSNGNSRTSPTSASMSRQLRPLCPYAGQFVARGSDVSSHNTGALTRCTYERNASLNGGRTSGAPHGFYTDPGGHSQAPVSYVSRGAPVFMSHCAAARRRGYGASSNALSWAAHSNGT